MNEMNEFELRDKLVEMRKKIETFEDLTEFLKYVEENCNEDYGGAPRAMAQACLAVGWYLSDKFGITGFQAGFVMWDFICGWTYTNNKVGLKMVNYDDMLYPQYFDHFEKVIRPDIWESLQKAAKERLEEHREYPVHPNVQAHWESIVAGNVPFGYTVKDD